MSQAKLDRECRDKYGEGWVWDPELRACIYVGTESVIQLPREKKTTVKIKVCARARRIRIKALKKGDLDGNIR